MQSLEEAGVTTGNSRDFLFAASIVANPEGLFVKRGKIGTVGQFEV
jgi:hypothetical protein